MEGPAERVRARIARQGPLPWSAVVDAALYGPGGFYTGGGGAGRTRDYLTSPSLGPLFGAVVSRAIDECWVRCGRPDPWLVVEAGAGAGDLALAVLAAQPECRAALRYVAVEISPALRAVASDRLPAEDPAHLLGPLVPADEPERRHRPGLGPVVAVLPEMPAGPFTGMIIANELLDNLPFDVYERSAGEWREVRVTASSDLGEIVIPAAPEIAELLEKLAPGAPTGARVPWQAFAASWWRDAVASVECGQVLAVDYGRSTAEMAADGDWLRTYRHGGRGTAPLAALGTQDITTDVAVDQLQQVDPAVRVTTQAAWLENHGLDALTDAAAVAWRARAAVGDLDALRARSRVGEGTALVDTRGLGSFVALERVIGD